MVFPTIPPLRVCTLLQTAPGSFSVRSKPPQATCITGLLESARTFSEKYRPPLVVKDHEDPILHERELTELLDRYEVVTLICPPRYRPFDRNKELSIRDLNSYERTMCHRTTGTIKGQKTNRRSPRLRCSSREHLAIDLLVENECKPISLRNRFLRLWEAKSCTRIRTILRTALDGSVKKAPLAFSPPIRIIRGLSHILVAGIPPAQARP